MITIVDYGVGNIRALLNMYDYLGIDAIAADNPKDVVNAKGLILPGVGSFDKAMRALNEKKLIAVLEHAVLEKRVPILGICLGMQILAKNSEEGTLPGLGWIQAEVKRIEISQESNLKVPNMGWRKVVTTRDSKLIPENEEKKYYFVHSYHMVCDLRENVLANVNYEKELCCAVNSDNIWGVQFHPEKSHSYGMRLLKAFSEMI